jgi:hypothetical protein
MRFDATGSGGKSRTKDSLPPHSAEPYGETLETLYQWASQREIEDAMRNWLRSTIAKLEGTPVQNATPQETKGASTPAFGGAAPQKGTAMFESQYPKCANPACPAAFHWLGGGKFFRFRMPGAPNAEDARPESPAHSHHVKHYWLCDRCATIYFLSCEEPQGVVVRPLWAELPAAEVLRKMSAA